MALSRREILRLGAVLAAVALPGGSTWAQQRPGPGGAGFPDLTKDRGLEARLWEPDDDPINYLKALIGVGLGEIPVVGSLLSALLGLLWPNSSADVWSQIKAQVEELIDQKINELEFSLIRAETNGLRAAIASYLLRLEGGASGSTIRNYFDSCNVVFEAALPKIQNVDYAYLNLPFFSIAAQLHLSLLRDGVKFGQQWGMSEADHALLSEELRTKISGYADFIDSTIADERKRRAKDEPTGDQQDYAALWNYWQKFDEQNVLLALDFKVLMPFMDPQAYPDGFPRSRMPFEDVFSRAYGSAEGWDGSHPDLAYQVEPIYRRPLAEIDRFEITAAGDTHTVNVCYPSGTGPRAASYSRAGKIVRESAERYDKTSLLADQPSYGENLRTIRVPKAPAGRRYGIESARVSYGDIVQRCSFGLIDGSELRLWWGDQAGSSARVAVSGRFLSTITMWTRNPRYNNVPGVLIFGFSIDPEYVAPGIRPHFAATTPLARNGTVSRAGAAARADFWKTVGDYASQADSGKE